MTAGTKISTTLLLLLIGLVGTTFTLLIIPFPFSRNTIDIEHAFTLHEDQISFLYDLDQDGIPDHTRLKTNLIGNAAIVVEAGSGHMIGQWNLPGITFDKTPMVRFRDINKDSIIEILVCTLDSNKFVLNAIYPFEPDNENLKSVCIDSVEYMPDPNDLNSHIYGVSDLNEDGRLEILCSINAGFALTPRKIYAVDLAGDSLWSSPNMGNKCFVRYVSDVLPIAGKEIFLGSQTTSNYDDTTQGYHDQQLYSFVLSQKLKPAITPNSFNIPFGVLRSFPHEVFGQKVIGSTIHDRRKQINHILIFDHNNRIVFERSDTAGQSFKAINHLWYDDGQNTQNIFQRGNQLFELTDTSLKLIKTVKSKIQRFNNYRFFQPSSQLLKYQYILSKSQKKLFINNFMGNEYIEIDLPPLNSYNISSSGISSHKSEERVFFIQFGKTMFQIFWRKNPWYPWYYLYFPVIAFFWFVLILLIYRISKARIQSQYAIKTRMQELELLTVKNQISPHFTFNAINSIGSLIYREKKEVAYKYLGRFSELIRNSLDNSTQISIALEREIAFTRNYLELEKLRFMDKFEFEIHVDEEVDLMQTVPKMMLQIHVENSIKHGIIPCDQKCWIRIWIEKTENGLTVIVRDNGIGRKAAAAMKSSGTGNGTRIIRQIFEHFEQTYRSEINYHVRDLYDIDDNPSGTEVIVEIRN